jgi:hypothetical protein
MSAEKPHFVARKMQDYQRQSSKIYVCGKCPDGPSFATEARLFDHAAQLHAETVGSSRDSKAFRDYAAEAVANKKYVFMTSWGSVSMSKQPLFCFVGRPRSKSAYLKFDRGLGGVSTSQTSADCSSITDRVICERLLLMLLPSCQSLRLLIP